MSGIPSGPLAPLVLRCLLGGLLMGLANLVPGISGGTMLLAAGVYPYFIDGIAEVTTLKFRRRTLTLLAAIGGAAALVILSLAGLVRDLVVDHRWIMYSLFIGLTLGGVPVVWKLLRRWSVSALAGCAAGIAVMILVAALEPSAGSPDDRAYLVLVFGGLAGASAMILPGISGGYLLLVLGQYVTILSAIDDAKTGLQASDWARVAGAMHVFIPVGIGVVAGVVGVSNLIRLLLERHRRPTLGLLLGLVLGAVVGLWPFQQGVPPRPGAVVRGRIVTADNAGQFDPKYYPLEHFTPGAGQVVAAVGLIAAGFLLTQGIALVGGSESEAG